MSVITEADRHRDLALEQIDNAIENLAKIIVDKVWGHDQYSDEYHKELRQTLYDLIEIRNRFKS